MNEFDLELRLDEDFVFILNFSGKFLNNFENRPAEHELCQAWLEKLCLEPLKGNTSKRTRNTYLCKLLTCMQAGNLVTPFESKPKAGPLPPLPSIPIADEEPPWIQELMQDQSDDQLDAPPSANCETYFSSKILNGNKGACAYIAISMPEYSKTSADKNSTSSWSAVGTPNVTPSEMDYIAASANIGGVKSVNKSAEKLRHIIQNELNEITVPYSNNKVELLVQQFEQDADHLTKQKISKMLPTERRRWLLEQIQIELPERLEKLAKITENYENEGADIRPTFLPDSCPSDIFSGTTSVPATSTHSLNDSFECKYAKDTISQYIQDELNGKTRPHENTVVDLLIEEFLDGAGSAAQNFLIEMPKHLHRRWLLTQLLDNLDTLFAIIMKTPKAQKQKPEKLPTLNEMDDVTQMVWNNIQDEMDGLAKPYSNDITEDLVQQFLRDSGMEFNSKKMSEQEKRTWLLKQVQANLSGLLAYI